MSVKIVSDLKAKAIDFESKHRLVPKVMAVATAVSLMGVPVSAAQSGGGSSTVDISTVTDSITSSLTDLVGKVAIACAGVVGVGLTIFGIKWAVTKVMAFFKAIGR